jgi:hypothetical protein
LTANEHVPLVAIAPPARVTLVEPAAAVIVPVPQVPVSPFGVETTKPAGSASVNATPASAIDALGFEMVKVSDVEPASPMEAEPKVFVMLGGVATVKFAVAVLPVPPLVEVTAPVVLVETPALAPVTLTLNVQDVPAAMVAPVRPTAPEPAVAVIVPPPHDPARPLGVATVIPAGNVSVNATPANAAVFAAGFVMVKLRVEFPFGETAVGLKAFTMDGGATTTMLAEAVPPAPPSVEVTFPVVLFSVPAAIPVTFTANVHEPAAARVAPVRLIAPVPGVAVMVPAPQVPARPLGVETARPAGRASVKPTPDKLCVALLF